MSVYEFRNLQLQLKQLQNHSKPTYSKVLLWSCFYLTYVKLIKVFPDCWITCYAWKIKSLNPSDLYFLFFVIVVNLYLKINCTSCFCYRVCNYSLHRLLVNCYRFMSKIDTRIWEVTEWKHINKKKLGFTELNILCLSLLTIRLED